MAWKETCVLEQRTEFIKEYLAGCGSFKELCTRYGVSEKTGHKWKNRFLQYGFTGLNDQSKAPESSPGQLDEDTVIRLIKLRMAHPTWGAKKLAVLYAKAYPSEDVPSSSSIYRVLGKAGLINKRRIRPVKPDTSRLRNRIPANEPNDVWTVDFKGYWYSGGEQCLPLTIRDLASKYILCVRLMQSSSADAVKAVFEELFYKYGLPKVIRSDNGTPFASTFSALGLTKLSAWWIYNGIIPDRTDPGCPSQNGSHERMHADLSREIQGKIPGGVTANQQAIDLWVEEYNHIRPHEALGMQTPAEVYRKSEIEYAGTPEELEYPITFMTRKINKHGYVKLNKTSIPVSSSLRGMTVGLQPTDYNEYMLWLADFPLGTVSAETYCFSSLGKLE
jgi:transposase InsO family protein